MRREATYQALRSCSPEPLETRELIDVETAQDLAALFKAMANTGRLRMIHRILGAGEICVNDLAESVGMKPQAVSNQLQRLVDRGFLGSRRSGNNILYRITNPCVVAMLDYGLCVLESEKMRNGNSG